MEHWDAVLAELRTAFSKDRFEMWFRTMKCNELTDSRIVLEVPNAYVRDWIATQYVDRVRGAVAAVVGQPLEIVIEATEDGAGQRDLFAAETDDGSEGQTAAGQKHNGSSGVHRRQGPGSGSASRSTKSTSDDQPPASPPFDANGDPLQQPVASGTGALITSGRNLSPEYLFETFVVGPSNQFAHAAALAVAQRPAENYNPLFIYGGVGLGKTHLMQAIGRSVIDVGLRVAYVTSEQFMNELIAGIEQREMAAFRERYRSQCDVLLIDDIQFIAGKQSTQEEFFHTFNALYGSRKQIVLTSDKSPQEIPGLEERLQSRFSWGLMADIQRPEMETRVAILKKKANHDGINLPDEVAVFMANHVDSNIRELEGCLKRLTARTQLTGQPPTIEVARQIVDPFIAQREANLTPERLIKLVANYFNVKPAEIKGRSRARRVSYPRQLAMYLSRKHTSLSYPALGREFKKDHSTVINAFQKIERLLEEDPTVRGDVEALERNLA